MGNELKRTRHLIICAHDCSDTCTFSATIGELYPKVDLFVRPDLSTDRIGKVCGKVRNHFQNIYSRNSRRILEQMLNIGLKGDLNRPGFTGGYFV